MLSLSSKYAVRALLALKEEPSERYLSVEELAAKTDVPAAYLSKVIKALERSALVETKRGVQGGVRVSRKETSLYEVCVALEDPAIVEKCIVSNKRCIPSKPCPFHQTWTKERGRIVKFLHGTKLKQSRSKRS